MKKLLNIYDKDEEILYKNDLMKYSGIPKEYITFQEVNYRGNSNEFLHVTIIDDPNFVNKDTMVLLHGLTGSSIVFYKMFQKLSTTYRVIGIDLPGMGCSSRNEVSYTEFQQTADYFTDRIKYTVDALNLDKFTLCGHSFGGYVSGLFSIKYPDHINKIIFLSPVGISSEITSISTNAVEDMVHKLFYNLRGPPTIGFKMFGFFSNVCFHYLMDHKCRNMTKEGEARLFKNFMSCLFRNTCVSEKAVFQFFDIHCRAFNPLINNYKKLQDKPIIFFYGDKDWCPISHAQMLKEFIPKVRIEVVPDSGHLLYADNTDFICDKIIEFEYETQDMESVSTTEMFSSDSNDK
jgi:cardiolipin-specific phospholipase